MVNIFNWRKLKIWFLVNWLKIGFLDSKKVDSRGSEINTIEYKLLKMLQLFLGVCDTIFHCFSGGSVTFLKADLL